MKEKQLRREQRVLHRENRRLRRENEYLRHRLDALGDRAEEKSKKPVPEREYLRFLTLARARSYLEYLLLTFKMNRAFRVYDKTTFAVRNFFFFSKLWRLAGDIWKVVSIGARVVLFAGVFTVLLPAALIFSLAAAILGFASYFSTAKKLSVASAGKTVYLLFMPERNSRYFDAMCCALAGEGLVFLVSRSWRACGFSSMRKLRDNVYRIHIGYYFFFCRYKSRQSGALSPRRIYKII